MVVPKLEDGGSSGVCDMFFPSALIKAVKDYAEPQKCENCGRLLLT